MIKIGLCPDCELDKMTVSKFIEKRNELTKSNDKFKKQFPLTYNYDLTKLNDSYVVDGWDYANFEELDNNAWLITKGRGKNRIVTHRYYNELDHYLTYLIGAIRTGKETDSSKEEGLICLKKDLQLLK